MRTSGKLVERMDKGVLQQGRFFGKSRGVCLSPWEDTREFEGKSIERTIDRQWGDETFLEK